MFLGSRFRLGFKTGAVLALSGINSLQGLYRGLHRGGL